MSHDLCTLFLALMKARKSGEDSKEKFFFLVCTFSILRTRLSGDQRFFMKSFNLCPKGWGGGGGSGWVMNSSIAPVGIRRGADELGHRDVTSSYTGKFNKNVVIRDFIFDSVD